MTIELTHKQACVIRLASCPAANFERAVDSGFITSINVRDMAATKLGKALLAEHDAKWATVRKCDLQIVIEELSAKICEHDELYAGYPDQLARMDDARRAMTRLREAVK